MTAPEPSLGAFLEDHALAGSAATSIWTPLSGGVSSDIWRVETDRGVYCVKRALAKLKVAEDWEASVDRNAFEWAFMEVAAAISPGSIPTPIAHDPERGIFAMSWLPPEQHRLWKSELLAGRVEPSFARAVGDLVGLLHQRTADNRDIAARFATDANFHALRIDPYLLVTAFRHPDVAKRLRAIAATTANTRHVLVHGDVSPKNILIGPAGPILLDAEVAWFGDPAFDLAFCLNHLLIKSRVVPLVRGHLLSSFDEFASAYLAHVDWEHAAKVEARAALLLPALALARVDGRSPVEYLDGAARAGLREAARSALVAGHEDLRTVRDMISMI